MNSIKVLAIRKRKALRPRHKMTWAEFRRRYPPPKKGRA